MEFVAKYLGGSHLYGLDTPESDLDERGLYLTDDLTAFFGFKKDESKVTDSATKDEAFFEFKYFLQLLNKTNTNSLECLFAPKDAFSVYTELFEKLQVNRRMFVNSDKLLKSLQGYTHNEARLALGERTGKLGGKRKANLDQYGFSPKNVSHMVRLAYCAEVFFRTGDYPVSLVGSPVFDQCYMLKTEPETYTVEEVTAICNAQKEKVDNLVDNLGFRFNNDLASLLLKEAYQDLLIN